MKRTLFTALFILSGISSFGQKIYFSDSTNVWNEFITSGYPITYYSNTINYRGDTIRNGINYQILNAPVSGICLIREDTIASKVYATILPSYSGIDTTEQVLYDYNWQVGDTIIRNVADHYVHVISSIDSTLINYRWYKVWHFQAISASAGTTIIATKDFDIIEGIGCTDDPLFPLFPSNFESATQLTCFSNRGNTPVVAPEVSGYFNNTTSCTLSTNRLVQKNTTAVIFPNPIDETSKIVFSYNISSGSLIVVNDIGQVVINTTFQNKTEVLIGDMIHTPGLYFYRVTDDQSNKVFTGKFIFR